MIAKHSHHVASHRHCRQYLVTIYLKICSCLLIMFIVMSFYSFSMLFILSSIACFLSSTSGIFSLAPPSSHRPLLSSTFFLSSISWAFTFIISLANSFLIVGTPSNDSFTSSSPPFFNSSLPFVLPSGLFLGATELEVGLLFPSLPLNASSSSHQLVLHIQPSSSSCEELRCTRGSSTSPHFEASNNHGAK